MQVPETEVIVTAPGGVELLRTVLVPGDYVLGRDPDCELRITVDLVSRKHAQLTVNFDHALIEDLKSSNGTFVNGQPITKCTRLWPNQKIQIGTATVELHRIKSVPPPDVSLAPQTAAMRRLLPEEFLHDKKYDIGKVVAQGGMGAILDAKEATTERRVAMKVMLDGSSPDDLTRFIAEAKVTAQLEHPNVVPVHELGIDENGQPFYTMKMVRGVTLRKVLELLAEGASDTMKKYPLPALLTIFQKVCDAMAFAHSKGVIHRDLKPENIMLDDFGVVLVMDWGLAKVLEKKEGKAADLTRSIVRTIPSDAASGTIAGTVMGTPQYMSPEQARGEVDTMDGRSDIYALGTILYHILALHPPVTGHTAPEVVAKVADGDVEPLTAPRQNKHSHLPGGRLPDSLAAVTRKAMAFERTARYAHVANLQQDLTAYQTGFATSAERAGFGKQLILLIKRNQGIFATGVAAWLIITALAVWFVIDVTQARNRAVQGETTARKERDRAENEKTRAEAEKTRANDTLGKLRGTAPTFFAQALALIDKQQFPEALEKINYAAELNPAEPAYHYVKANILEDLSRLFEAQQSYAEALHLNPSHAFARENLELCKQVLREENGRKELSKASVTKLNLLMRKEGRAAEAIATVRVLSKDRQALYETWNAVLAKAGWQLSSERLILDDDGLFRVDLRNLKVDDIAFLRGMPLKWLSLAVDRVSDLRPLKDAPLQVLNLNGTAVTDLTALRGLKLTELSLDNTKVADLSPLQGMPLEKLTFWGDQGVTDISALRGMPLRFLILKATNVGDIRPLQGMPLVNLNLETFGNIDDFSPLKGMRLIEFATTGHFLDSGLALLKGMPLEALYLNNVGISDLRPLQGMPLQSLGIHSNRRIKDLTPLAGLKLKFIDLRDMPITDLSPLRNMPIDVALLDGIPATDFSVIQTWPLGNHFSAQSTVFNNPSLVAGKSTKFIDLTNTPASDIGPLKGMTIHSLFLAGTKVTDLHPVANLPDLEELTIPVGAGDIDFLRLLPNIQGLDNRSPGSGHNVRPATEFWKKYDERHAEKK